MRNIIHQPRPAWTIPNVDNFKGLPFCIASLDEPFRNLSRQKKIFVDRGTGMHISRLTSSAVSSPERTMKFLCLTTLSSNMRKMTPSFILLPIVRGRTRVLVWMAGAFRHNSMISESEFYEADISVIYEVRGGRLEGDAT